MSTMSWKIPSLAFNAGGSTSMDELELLWNQFKELSVESKPAAWEALPMPDKLWLLARANPRAGLLWAASKVAETFASGLLESGDGNGVRVLHLVQQFGRRQNLSAKEVRELAGRSNLAYNAGFAWSTLVALLGDCTLYADGIRYTAGWFPSVACRLLTSMCYVSQAAEKSFDEYAREAGVVLLWEVFGDARV